MVKFAPYGDINSAIDIFWGLSTDPKPTTDIIAGSVFIETDTLTLSMWNGTSWQTNNASNAAQLVTPNGSSITQDSNGNIGTFSPSGIELYYFVFNSSNDSVQLWTLQGDGSYAEKIDFTPTGGIRFPLLLEAASNLYMSGGSTLIYYNGISTKGIGLGAIYGLDNRTGITTADAAAITLYTTTAAGQLFRVNARAFATVGTSATYVIKWTEGGVVNTETLSVTALDTEVTQNFSIQLDNGTAITAQITAISATTLNVATTVEQLA